MFIKVWYLSTCSTCRRIMKELNLNEETATLQDIKAVPPSAADIDFFYQKTQSYKALINGRSMEFRKRSIKPSEIDESRAKELLLDHYAFLKRPVIQIDDRIFVGNSAKTISEIKQHLN
ncbi:arsenate reductase family protein [Membranihabitans marinus]|uniref:arsenate reductase family protein n=1 Tax=Membranihabitans marinus TaxID=1227546 RepID=UPI001F163133|nr:ArsC/Spx/MgsR family protein [Membranihabitans marinus]